MYILEVLVDESVPDEIKEYYFNVPRLNWKVSLWESQLHSLDMRNANNPDNKWEPFDFYVVPNKVDSRYHDVLCLFYDNYRLINTMVMFLN